MKLLKRPLPESHFSTFALACVAFAIALHGNLSSAQETYFEKHVAPVFQRRCLSCHSTSDKKGRLSLQSAAAALKGGESGEVILSGDPESSLLLEYISGDEPEMPKDGEPLSKQEVAAIRTWIQQGAEWPKDLVLTMPAVTDLNWWSLRPLERPPLPKLVDDDKRRVQSPIDYFILAKLREKKLRASPPANRRALIRRVYFDLIGLPPTPNDVDAFINDPDPLAYEKLVDRLLASPRYGERWARHWLDVVKYADTCGYDKDKLRPNAWPYRDYVVRSFNQDKLYSRFVHEQIAGDALFPDSPDGILGLGFIAAGPWDFIGHVEVPESKIDGKVARNLDRDEMVTNTLNTFCSTTVQCARCHNHKFDPITQEHYYSLQSIFAAVDRAERPYDLDPTIEQQRRELDRQLQSLVAEQKKLEDQIRRDGGPELAQLEKQIAELKPKAIPKNKRPEYGYHSAIVKTSDTKKWVEIDLGREVEVAKIVMRPCHDEYAGIGAGFGFPIRFEISSNVVTRRVSEEESSPKDPSLTRRVSLLADQTNVDVPNPSLAPFEIDLDDTKAQFIRVTATKLAERKNDYIFALAELQVFDPNGKNVALNAKVRSLDSIQAPVRWRRSNLTDGIWAEAADENAIKDLATAQKNRSAIMARINTPESAKQKDKLAAGIQSTQKQLNALPKGRMVYAAATQFATRGNFKPTDGKPRMVRVLHRGNVLEPRDEVQPGTLPIIDGTDWQFNLDDRNSESDRRVALARWITRHDNPLTWRSIVNRIWLYHFGKGLVESPNDFGRMGKEPSHPELLNWLAAEFRDNGQSFKRLHRMILTSSTYRQTSAHNDTNAKIDGSNQFLWRMNRRRLEAEEIRDSILAVSGRLDLRMGGPGYYLFMLEKTAHSPHYEYHKFDPNDTKSHRRSLYRFIVRSQPDPFMTTLDCADSSQSTPRRDETLTSLQALSLLNNRFNLTMAKHFTIRLEAEQKEIGSQVERAMRLVAGRSPTDSERVALEQYAAKHGVANLCRLLFNLSEFVYLD